MPSPGAPQRGTAAAIPLGGLSTTISPSRGGRARIAALSTVTSCPTFSVGSIAPVGTW